MPEVSRFYGIIIKMFFKPKEHEPAHIIAIYGESLGVFDVQSMMMTEGDLPNRAQEFVKMWMAGHQNELLEMWKEQKPSAISPLI